MAFVIFLIVKQVNRFMPKPPPPPPAGPPKCAPSASAPSPRAPNAARNARQVVDLASHKFPLIGRQFSARGPIKTDRIFRSWSSVPICEPIVSARAITHAPSPLHSVLAQLLPAFQPLTPRHPLPHNPDVVRACAGRSLLFGRIRVRGTWARSQERSRVKRARRPGNIEKRAGHGRESILWLIQTSRERREETRK